MQKMIVVEIAGCGERLDERQRRPRAVDHRDRHCTVQRHDGRWLHAFERIVEPDDLWPVSIFSLCRLTMLGGYRRLQRKLAGLATQ